MKLNNNTNNLKGMATFALFVSSYLPLFILLILGQISKNYDYLHFAKISFESIKIFIYKFGLTSILLSVSIIGYVGYKITLGNLEKIATNGNPIHVTDVKNKNSEAIGYIATYVAPFIFQGFDDWYQLFSVLFLLIIIYRIYINSTLILINPLLSLKYSIYEIEYEQNGKTKNGMIISKNKSLEDDSFIKIYSIGHKLYFSIDN